MVEIANWIVLENLNPLLEEIAEMAGESLDEGIHRVFVDDIKESDADASPERWATCLFDGPNPITAHLAIDRDAGLLSVRLELGDHASRQANSLLGLMQRYTFVPQY